MLINRTILFILIITALISPAPSKSASKILKAQLEIVEEKGVKLKLIPETIVDTDLSLEGDFFSAYLSRPSASLLNVPEGSRLLGKITKIQEPGSFKRSAKLSTHIENLMLPDGSLVKVSADLVSKASWRNREKAQPIKNTISKALKASTEVGAATMVGAIDSIQYAGLGTAIATDGISAIAGAGAGLGLGIYGLFKNPGQELISSGFDPVIFKLVSDFQFLDQLPLMSQNFQPISAKLLGLDVKLNSVKTYKTKDFGEILVIDMALTNKSFRDFAMGDFVLSSNYHLLPVYNNPLLSENSFSKLDPETSANMKIAFSLGKINKKQNYRVMMLDSINQEVIASLDLDLSAYL